LTVRLTLDFNTPLLGRVGTVLEMIKVVVHEFQSAWRALSDPERVENTRFRTL
jgi:hypothetical protein